VIVSLLLFITKNENMKHLSRPFVLLAVLFMGIISSCNKKSAQDLVNSYVNSLSATINNTSTSTNASFTASNTNATKNGSQLTIDGSNGNQRITIAINN